MKLHRPLDDLLTGTAPLRGLRVIARMEGSEFTAGELVRRSGLVPSQAWSLLHRLRTQGMVTVRYVGRTAVWRAEPKNQILTALRGLLEVEDGLWDAVMEQVRRDLRSTPATRAVVFGSAARGEERPGSDLDLFVEVPSEPEKERLQGPLLRLYDHLAERFGCYLAPVVLSRVDIEHAKGLSLLEEIDATGRVVFDRRAR